VGVGGSAARRGRARIPDPILDGEKLREGERRAKCTCASVRVDGAKRLRRRSRCQRLGPGAWHRGVTQCMSVSLARVTATVMSRGPGPGQQAWVDWRPSGGRPCVEWPSPGQAFKLRASGSESAPARRQGHGSIRQAVPLPEGPRVNLNVGHGQDPSHRSLRPLALNRELRCQC
jgi:hypothetical protein